MATNRTPNLGLNQWQRDEEVIMDDFNADNAKIDTAVAETRAEIAEARQEAAQGIADAAAGNMVVKLMEVTVPTSGITTIEMKLNGIDLTQFSSLKLCNANTSGNLYFRMNSVTSGYYQGNNTYDRCSSSYGYVDFIMTGNMLQVIYFTTSQYNHAVSVSAFKTIQILPSSSGSTDSFAVGRKFSLLGVKR